MDPYGPMAASGELSAATQDGGKKGYLPSSPSEYLPLVCPNPFCFEVNPGGRSAWKEDLTEHLNWKRVNHLLLQIRDLRLKRDPGPHSQKARKRVWKAQV